MDGEPTRKKPKVNEIENKIQSSVQADADRNSGDEAAGMEVDVESRKGNYFTPAFMDLWPNILDNMTDPKDVVSLLNASRSQELHSLLEKQKTSALLPLVLPILLKRHPPALVPSDVSKCRLVSKQVKASADDFLAQLDEGDRDHWIRADSYKLRGPESIQTFSNTAQGFNGNPFLGRYCEANLFEDEREQLANVMEVFRSYGHELHAVELRLFMDLSFRRGLGDLKGALRRLPNLRTMDLRFFHIDPEDGEEWPDYSAEHSRFPPLEKLTGLILYNFDYYHGLIPPGSFVRPILKAYGDQLTNLYCESTVFGGELWRPLHFCNLVCLELYIVRGGRCACEQKAELSQTYRNLAKLQCPKLERLYVCGPGIRLTAETFLMLNKFRKSLKYLHMANLEGDLQLFQVDPSIILQFPQLTQLTLFSVDVGTEWIHVFRVMFPNLEEIWFQSSLTNPGSRIAVEPPVPDETLVRRYYNCFPKLKKLRWHWKLLRRC